MRLNARSASGGGAGRAAAWSPRDCRRHWAPRAHRQAGAAVGAWTQGGGLAMPRSAHTALHRARAVRPAGAPPSQVSWMSSAPRGAGGKPRWSAWPRCRRPWGARARTMRVDDARRQGQHRARPGAEGLTGPEGATEGFAEEPLAIGRHSPGTGHGPCAGAGAAATHASRVLPTGVAGIPCAHRSPPVKGMAARSGL